MKYKIGQTVYQPYWRGESPEIDEIVIKEIKIDENGVSYNDGNSNEFIDEQKLFFSKDEAVNSLLVQQDKVNKETIEGIKALSKKREEEK